MCNRYRNYLQKAGLIDEISDIKIPLRFADNLDSNRGLTGDIKPTDPAYVLRSDGLLTILPWGFPSKRGPVINVRDDNHRYPVEQRGLTPLTSFYESTDPADPKQKVKDWWEFSPVVDQPLMFAVALHHDGFYSLITTEPGEDIKAIKHRQPTVLMKDQWQPWLNGADDLFQPSPAGMWKVERKVFQKVSRDKALLL